MYGKCQAVGFIWPFGGMTKDLSLKCIMYILLLYGFLNSPFDCSAYDRFVCLHVLYSCGDFSFSGICWKPYVKASFVLPGSVCFLQVRVKIYIKIVLDFKEQSCFHLFVSRDSAHLWRLLHLFPKYSLYLVERATQILCMYLQSCS